MCERGIKSPVVIGRTDYDNATMVNFKIGKISSALVIPDDVTEEEFVGMIWAFSEMLKEKRNGVIARPFYSED